MTRYSNGSLAKQKKRKKFKKQSENLRGKQARKVNQVHVHCLI